MILRKESTQPFLLGLRLSFSQVIRSRRISLTSGLCSDVGARHRLCSISLQVIGNPIKLSAIRAVPGNWGVIEFSFLFTTLMFYVSVHKTHPSKKIENENEGWTPRGIIELHLILMDFHLCYCGSTTESMAASFGVLPTELHDGSFS